MQTALSKGDFLIHMEEISPEQQAFLFCARANQIHEITFFSFTFLHKSFPWNTYIVCFTIRSYTHLRKIKIQIMDYYDHNLSLKWNKLYVKYCLWLLAGCIPAMFCVGQPRKRSGKAKMMANSRVPLHKIAEALTERLSLRRITPPAMMPNMADGMLKPPKGIQRY